MSSDMKWTKRPVWVAVTVVTVPVLILALTGVPVLAEREEPDYVGDIEVVRTASARPQDTARGVVFEDRNRDSRHGRSERGLKGVSVTNGRDVVLTDAQGRYEIPAFDNMTLSITKPAGYDVPVDEHNFPQFFYHHLPQGSPDLRFEGLPPTGPLPTAINFPLARSTNASQEFNCAVIGDTQTYSNREIGYLRDGVVEDLAARDDLDECGALLLGDLMGDDLGLYPHFKEVMSQADVPVRAVPGNHDLDFDATSNDHSKDTYRREIGPAWYSFDIGNVHFVGLDNVRYPCTPEDNADGKHEFCDDPENHPTYNGVIGEEQMTWLANDLAQVPQDKLVVVATHIPLVSYIDMNATKHQTDDANELYALLADRQALSVSGHTHTVESMTTGTSFAGWQEAVGVDQLPFPHVVSGAASGSWWGGDLDADGIPMSFARNGTPGGYAIFSFNDNQFTSSYDLTTLDDDQTIGLSLNSPRFRQWAEELREWEGDTDDTPPVNINDLGDPNVVAADQLAETWMVANVYNGSKDTQVTAVIDDGEPLALEHTQPGQGEGINEGLEFADPFAMTRQLQVARHAFRSTSGDERTQGYERFRGRQFGPSDPRPEDEGTDQSPHIWRLQLPADLEQGAHTATVSTVDPIGGEHTQVVSFEVVDELPQQYFRTEVFEDQ